ncbi:hypothetical protein AHAS_Ahas20G0074300 [Arachis hypogaea]
MFPTIGKALGDISHFELTPMEKHQAHHHVLVNCDAMVRFVDLRTQTKLQAKIDSVVHTKFPWWFKHELIEY